MGFLAFALLLPKSSETCCCAEFERFGLLALSNVQGVVEAVLRCRGIVRSLLQEEFTFEAMNFGFVPSFTSGVHERQRFCERREPCLWLPEVSMGFCQECEPIWS